MVHYRRITIYVSKYGNRETDIEISVELRGTMREIIAQQKAAEMAMLEHFKQATSSKKVQYNTGVDDEGIIKRKARGFRELHAGSRGKTIVDLQSKVRESLEEALKEPKKPKKKRRPGRSQSSS